MSLHGPTPEGLYGPEQQFPFGFPGAEPASMGVQMGAVTFPGDGEVGEAHYPEAEDVLGPFLSTDDLAESALSATAPDLEIPATAPDDNAGRHATQEAPAPPAPEPTRKSEAAAWIVRTETAVRTPAPDLDAAGAAVREKEAVVATAEALATEVQEIPGTMPYDRSALESPPVGAVVETMRPPAPVPALQRQLTSQDHVARIGTGAPAIGVTAPPDIAKAFTYGWVAELVEAHREAYAQNPTPENRRQIVTTNLDVNHLVYPLVLPPNQWFRPLNIDPALMVGELATKEAIEVLLQASFPGDLETAIEADAMLLQLRLSLEGMDDPRTGQPRTGPVPLAELRDAISMHLKPRTLITEEIRALDRDAQGIIREAISKARKEGGQAMGSVFSKLHATLLRLAPDTPPELEVATRSLDERVDLHGRMEAARKQYFAPSPTGVTVVNIDAAKGTPLDVHKNGLVATKALPYYVATNTGRGFTVALAMTGTQKADPNDIIAVRKRIDQVHGKLLVEGDVSEQTTAAMGGFKSFVIGQTSGPEQAAMVQRLPQIKRETETGGSASVQYGRSTGDHTGGSRNWEQNGGPKPKSGGDSWTLDTGLSGNASAAVNWGNETGYTADEMNTVGPNEVVLFYENQPLGVYDMTTGTRLRDFPPVKEKSPIRADVEVEIADAKTEMEFAAHEFNEKKREQGRYAVDPESGLPAPADTGTRTGGVPSELADMAKLEPETTAARRQSLGMEYSRAHGNQSAFARFARGQRATAQALNWWWANEFLPSLPGQGANLSDDELHDRWATWRQRNGV
jgi:hypothetical protein